MRAAILLVLAACGGAKAPSPESPHNESKTEPKPTRALQRGDGFASKDALYAAVVRAIATRTPQPLAPAIPTVDVVAANCPDRAKDKEELAHGLDKAIDETQSKVDGCWQKGDLASLALVAPRDESLKPDKDCPGATNGRAKLALRAGSIDVVVRVKWVATKDGHVYLDDAPHCEDAD